MNIPYYVEFKVLPDNLFGDTKWFFENIIGNGKSGIARVFEIACEKSGTDNTYTADNFDVRDVSPTLYSHCYIVDFPAENAEPPLCKSAIITFDFRETVTPRYFTLEYGEEGRCFLAEITADGKHINYGVAPDGEELIEKVIMTAFGWEEFGGFSEEESILKSAEDYQIPSLRSLVENIYLKALFDYETPLFINEIFNKERFFVYSVFKRVYKLFDKPVPFGMTDILVELHNLEDENKVLFIIDMPKGYLYETECSQIYIAYDIDKPSRRYITFNYNGDNETSLNCYDLEQGNSGPFEAPADEKEFYNALLQIAFE